MTSSTKMLNLLCKTSGLEENVSTDLLPCIVSPCRLVRSIYSQRLCLKFKCINAENFFQNTKVHKAGSDGAEKENSF